MTGVAAILKYALPGLDDIDEADEGPSDKDSDEMSISSEEDNRSLEGKDYSKSSQTSQFDEEQLDVLMN